MIHVDESEPVEELEPCFPYHDVTIKKGVDAKEFYDLITEIGRGKFGTVYKCKEKSTGLQLAAKFIPIPKREDRRNVEREVDIMKILKNPKIIQLYDAYEFSKNMWVILELIEGGELFERVIDDDFILTEKACIVIIRQVCEAIEFIHRNNILHLDMKPENILCMTKEGNRIKIIDFGLARKYDPDKKLQVLFGTPEFVAPEVVNFDRISFGTDMWSVGVICYVLLSGLSPFMGETDIETMANVTISKYDFDDDAFNDVSKEAIDFITKLLVKDSSLRLSATDCLEHTWLKKRQPNSKPKTTKINEEELISNELEQTKDNLREFVERWGEHPNSPYAFDSESNNISPVRQEILSHSNMSSRGCSPSPCESLSSSTEQNVDDNTLSIKDDEHISENVNLEDTQNDDFEKETSDKDIKEYLQMFERRNSDSKYVLKKTQSLEKSENLADEIKKLSDRLLMLSKLNTELESSFNLKSLECNSSLQDLKVAVNNESKAKETKKSEFNKNSGMGSISEKANTINNFNSKNNQLNSKNINATSISSSSTFSSALLNNKINKLNNNNNYNRTNGNINVKSNNNLNFCPVIKTNILKNNDIEKSAHDSKKVTTKHEHEISKTTSKISKESSSSTSSSSSTNRLKNVSDSINIKRSNLMKSGHDISFGDKIGSHDIPFEDKIGSAPWPVSSRRTKFKISQLSRDVPISSPSIHSTIFINDSATATKDCLLKLLEKYNENRERKTMSTIGRHQSISTEWGISDNLENRSMNSINAFFHRHSSMMQTNKCKQIQAQIEGRKKP